MNATDEYDLVRAEVLLQGYAIFWDGDGIEVLGVEIEFDAPLVNPETGSQSRTNRLGGKMDVLARKDGHDFVLDHKVSSEDLTEGSTVWKRYAMSSQCPTYLAGARSLGYKPVKFTYDVLGKPQIRPKKATPEADRKYTLPKSKICAKCKKDPGGSHGCENGRIITDRGGVLHKTQRLVDETPEEFRARLQELIKSKPQDFYVRGDVVKIADDETEAAYDVWSSVAMMREARRVKRYPRNPNSCVSYGSLCNFFGVCTGSASLTDTTMFRVAANSHEELGVTRVGLPLVTNSEIGTFRDCPRQWYHRYEQGYRAVRESEAKSFGTLVHLGLQGYWETKMAGGDMMACYREGIAWMRRGKEPEKLKPLTGEAPVMAEGEIVL